MVPLEPRWRDVALDVATWLATQTSAGDGDVAPLSAEAVGS
jgi:hypothetical protein